MSSVQQDVLWQLFLQCRGELESMLTTRLRCRDTASDLSQEAFLRLCRAEDLGRVGNLRAYLFRTALNLLNDHYRAAAVREIIVPESPETPLEAEDFRTAEIVALADEQLDRVIAALEELSPQCQRIFYLNRFEGRRQKDIAETLGISVRTVEENLRRAMLHCLRRLDDA
ncbi:RNA polymerase sigma factor [Methyloterricola oryzae]|uniref:RNA polymerase sigma factor n=1 Tax=Methyloterricola oryzae TaxID=1495050 RepID=UPI0009E4EB8D|nr:RNA polymerase sigma factor [Methyloterricola oryzae]